MNVKAEGFSRKKSSAIDMSDPAYHYAIVHKEVEKRFDIDQISPLLDDGYEMHGENNSTYVARIPIEEWERRVKEGQEESESRMKDPPKVMMDGEARNKTDQTTRREVSVADIFKSSSDA